jgi:23S rRNA-/tRNA-specific pseudouridylate synthase
VVGDTLYGAPSRLFAGMQDHAQDEKTLARTFLHAAAIRFRHPRSGEELAFEVPLPAELQHFLDRLQAADGR